MQFQNKVNYTSNKNQEPICRRNRNCFFRNHVVSTWKLEGDKLVELNLKFFNAIIHILVMSIWTYTKMCCPSSKQKGLNTQLPLENKLQPKNDGTLEKVMVNSIDHSWEK